MHAHAIASPMLSPALEQLRSMAHTLVGYLPRIAVALIVLGLVYIAGRAMRAILGSTLSRMRRSRNASLLVARLAQSLFTLVGLLAAAAIVFPSFAVANIVQVLGIGSVAIGFAFRDILQNFLAGILVLWTEPFRIGDQIRYNDFEGTVEDVQTRATFIRTYDGRRVVIPNAELFTNAVTVNTAFESRRLEYDLGIGVSDGIDRAKEIIRAALADIPEVLDDPPPDVLVMDLADFSVKLRVRWWIKPPRRHDALDARDSVLAAIKERLTANGIDLPYPTTQILFHDQTEECDGDRRRQREGWPAGNDAVPRPRSAATAERSHTDGERAARGR